VQPSLVIVYFGGNDSMGPHSSGLGPHVPLNEYIENMRKIAIHLKVFSWFLNIQSHYTNRSWLMHIRNMNETTLIRCKEIKTIFLLESLDKNYGKLSFWGEQKTGRFLWLRWGFRWKCCSYAALECLQKLEYFFYSIPDCWTMFNFLSSCISCILTLSSSENDVWCLF